MRLKKLATDGFIGKGELTFDTRINKVTAGTYIFVRRGQKEYRLGC